MCLKLYYEAIESFDKVINLDRTYFLAYSNKGIPQFNLLGNCL